MYQFSEKQKVYQRVRFVAFTKLGTLEGPCLHVLQKAVNIFQRKTFFYHKNNYYTFTELKQNQ